MDRAWLADWRRRIASLYVEVRQIAATDPAAALDHWRTARERLYRDHPQSPVPADARAAFHAAHFEHDPSLRFEVTVEPAPPPPPGASALRLPESDGGDTLAFSRIGRIAIPFADGPRTLAVYWMSGYTGGLFIPFRDATNGTRDLWRRALPGRWRQERRSRRRSGQGHAHDRLQLRLPAVVRVRPALGVPARAAREPARPPDPRRGASLTVRNGPERRGTVGSDRPAGSRRA